MEFDLIGAVCGACADKRSASLEEGQKKEAHEERVRLWQKICPALYSSTAWASHPELSPVAREVAKSWWAGRDGMGLGLHGPTGRGKSRAMFEILRRHHFAGRHVMAVQSMEIEEAAVKMFSDEPRARVEAQDLLRRCRTTGLLYIDDLGKEKMTERVAKEFHRLVAPMAKRVDSNESRRRSENLMEAMLAGSRALAAR